MPTAAPPLDEPGLRNLYRSHVVARRIIDEVASRGDAAGETPVEEFIGALQLERAGVIDALRQLGDVGCGEFVVGRRGAPSRFRWTIAPAALEARLTATTAVDEEAAWAAPADDAEPHHPSPDGGPLYLHRFQLRPELVIELRLPRDLTAREAARLGTFLAALPFE